MLITDNNECSSDPCIYGNCKDGVNSYSCSCEAGFTGVLCDAGTCYMLKHITLIIKENVIVNFLILLFIINCKINVRLDTWSNTYIWTLNQIGLESFWNPVNI